MEKRVSSTEKISRNIRGNFDRGAECYSSFEEGTSFFSAMTDELAAMGGSLEGKAVLDVGCGTGASLDAIGAKVGPGGFVAGVDISLGMLKSARSRMGEGVFLAQMDGVTFDSAFSIKFDAIFFNAVLFMMPEGVGAVESARRALKPGGSVYCSVLDEIVVMPAGAGVRGEIEKRGREAGGHALTPWKKLEKALAENFVDTKVALKAVDMTGGLFEEFYAMEPTSAGLMPKTPFAERKQLVSSMSRELEREGKWVRQIWKLAHGLKAL